MRALLSGLIVLLALAIGVLHFALIYVLFRGRIFGSFGGPPPGSPGLPFWPGVLPLPQLFLLNLIAFVLLAALFLVALRGRLIVRYLVDLLLVVVSLATLAGWNNIRRPNPRGLGTWAVSMEIAQIVLAIVHAATLRQRRV